jgi:2-polyprenyl-3-methyl-5-hydroxy-6-metoxy-1,4-benzoquinol methylase
VPDLKYAYSFDPAATNDTAAAVARHVLLGGRRVLDVGSGPGWVARHVASQGREVTCVDRDTEALAAAGQAGLRTVVTDLETRDWVDPLAGETYDVVVLADVLEHLREPGALLEALASSGLLAEDGRLVISVPNASHESVVAQLAVGDFGYTETGILDETHLRWFTRTSLERLLERSGFVVTTVERTRRTLEQSPHATTAPTLSDEFRRELRTTNPDVDTYQFVVVARPMTVAARTELVRAAAESDIAAAREEQARLVAEVDRLRALVVSQRSRFDAVLADGADELGTLDAEVRRHEGEARRLRSEVRRLEKFQVRAQNRRDRIVQLEAELELARRTFRARARSRAGRVVRRLKARG